MPDRTRIPRSPLRSRTLAATRRPGEFPYLSATTGPSEYHNWAETPVAARSCHGPMQGASARLSHKPQQSTSSEFLSGSSSLLAACDCYRLKLIGPVSYTHLRA